MKKLLNLFAGITLITTGASTVVACKDTKQDSKAANEKIVNNIATKIDTFLQSNPTIKIGKAYSNLKDPATIVALNNALKQQGLLLAGNPGDPSDPSVKPTGEWADLTYSGTLTTYEDSTLQINIQVGSGSSMVTKNISGLKVQNATDPEAVSHLKTQIERGLPAQPIILPPDVGNDASGNTNILNTELNGVLLNNNVTLNGNPGGPGVTPTGDWSHITYEGNIPSQAGTPGTIKIIITFGAQKEIIDNVEVKKAASNQERAEAIKGKIDPREVLTLPAGTNPDVTNPATRNALNNELKNENPNLEASDLQHITYKGPSLDPPGDTVPIDAVITFGDPIKSPATSYSLTIDNLPVVLAKTNAQILDALADELSQKTIQLPYGQNYDPTNDNDAKTIFDNLRNDNPQFKNNPPVSINVSFSGSDIKMESEQPIAVDMTLKLGTSEKTIPLQVSVNNTWKQTIFPQYRGSAGRRATSASYNGVKLGNIVYYATNNGLLYSSSTSGGWKFVDAIQRIRGGSAVRPNITQPPVQIGSTDYVVLQGKSNQTPAMFTSPHGMDQWTGASTSSIPLNETFQASPVRFNFGTSETPDYKYFLTSSSTGKVYTSDDGTNWNSTSTIGSAEREPSKIGDTLYQGTFKQGLWQGTDKGTSWTKVQSIPANGWIQYSPAQFGDGKPFVYVGNNSDTSENGVYYRNSDNSWTKSTTTKIDPSADFKSKPVMIGNNIYWQSTNKGLWMSKDNGATWSQTDSMKMMSGSGGQVNKIGTKYYVGTNNGVWTSSDGLVWKKNETTTLNSSVIVPGPINKINDSYQAATNNNGVWYT